MKIWALTSTTRPLGASAGMSAVLVLALYINGPATISLYPGPRWLWALPPTMLYWICRVWMKGHRGELHDDPVALAMSNKQFGNTARPCLKRPFGP